MVLQKEMQIDCPMFLIFSFVILFLNGLFRCTCLNQYRLLDQTDFTIVLKIKPNVVNLYWTNAITRKTLFSIKSFLYQTKIIWTIQLWIDSRTVYTDNTENQLKSLNVTVKPFIFNNEIKNTPFEIYNQSYPWGNSKSISVQSDWIRLILLYKYGGLYFDLDTLFLKPPEDMIVKYQQFVCPWGTGSLKNTNNNILYFKRDFIEKLCEAAIREKAAANFFGLSFLSYSNLKKYHVNVLSLCEVDACWGCPNISCNCHFIFEKQTNAHKFVFNFITQHSYAFHWHNGYNIKIEKDSIFTELEEKYNQKFKL